MFCKMQNKKRHSSSNHDRLLRHIQYAYLLPVLELFLLCTPKTATFIYDVYFYTHMITKVNDTDLKVLGLFTKGYNREYYIREVEKLLKVSSRTAFVTLAKLEKMGILESETRGKIRVYSIRKSGLSMEFFIMAEQYKRILFFGKNPLAREVLGKADGFMQGIVLIFGSYAKGMQKDDSDLDLFIVGKYDGKKIIDAGQKYGLNISIKSYPLAVFEKEIFDDILLREIAKDHIIIKNTDGFVRRAARWTR
jgi:uncharacterized protein